MLMPAGVRRFALTAHVTASVGWIGAVAAFLALAISGITRDDAQTVRGAYVAMGLTGWLIIVPLSFASLVTGLIQSFGTRWGLFRHYWVLIKLVINVLATALLLLHMRPTSAVAAVAKERALSATDFREIRVQLIADAIAALVILLVATTLSIYKPKGMTRYGWRKQREERLSAA